MRRRTFLLSSASAAVLLSGCAPVEVKTFATLAQAQAALANLRLRKVQTLGAWKIGAVLDHLAQSIEFSLHGFPEIKSSLFRHTAGAAAWSVFSARGAMSHSLSDPIQGAPALSLKRCPKSKHWRGSRRHCTSLKNIQARSSRTLPTAN